MKSELSTRNFEFHIWILNRTGIQNTSLPGGLEPPTFRLTVERANQLRHGSCCIARVAYFGLVEFACFCEIGATSVRKRPSKAYKRSILMFNNRC